MGVSDEAKQAGGGPKPLLLEQVQAELAAECLRRPKQGFVFPFAAWMRGALRPYCEDRLFGPRSGSRRPRRRRGHDSGSRSWMAVRPSAGPVCGRWSP